MKTVKDAIREQIEKDKTLYNLKHHYLVISVGQGQLASAVTEFLEDGVVLQDGRILFYSQMIFTAMSSEMGKKLKEQETGIIMGPRLIKADS